MECMMCSQGARCSSERAAAAAAAARCRFTLSTVAVAPVPGGGLAPSSSTWTVMVHWRAFATASSTAGSAVERELVHGMSSLWFDADGQLARTYVYRVAYGW
jgi:hypothetical protein